MAGVSASRYDPLVRVASPTGDCRTCIYGRDRGPQEGEGTQGEVIHGCLMPGARMSFGEGAHCESYSHDPNKPLPERRSLDADLEDMDNN